MEISREQKLYLVSELEKELHAKRDGGNKNLIARCPYCNKEGKYGVYVGPTTNRKETFMAHCFSCGRSTRTLDQLLETIGRMDLAISKTADPTVKLDTEVLFPLHNEEEIDDQLVIVEMPDFYKRTFSNPYLRKRGFGFDDYEYFPVGVTGGLNRPFDHYVIFPIIDEGDTVGFVSRHTWSKQEIDRHNRKAKATGGYKLLRFKNSVENDFVKLLYNYDAVRPEVTDTVMLVEGIFDVIALARTMELYDNPHIAVVATFGKKISRTQIYKLQKKGVRTVVIAYDGDAVDTMKKIAGELSVFFEVLIADIPYHDKDWEDLSFEQTLEIFSTGLKTPIEYKLKKLQEI